MITDTPEEWGSPFGDWFDKNIKPLTQTLEDTVKARTPSGGIIEMPKREFDSKVAVGLSLTEVEGE